jgi:hypothetical protein
MFSRGSWAMLVTPANVAPALMVRVTIRASASARIRRIFFIACGR